MAKQGYLNFRLSAEEHAELSMMAQRGGYSLSEFARKCLRAGMRFAEDFPPKPTDHAVRMRRTPRMVAPPSSTTTPAA